MNLETINKRLIEISQELREKLTNYSKLQNEYELRKAGLMMDEETKGFANQALRDAYILKVLSEEDIYTKYNLTHNEIKLLYIEKEILIEVSRNLRELNHD